MGRKKGGRSSFGSRAEPPASTGPSERLRVALHELSGQLAVIRVGRTAEVLTADGTAIYRAYSAVQDPQALLLHLVERALARRRQARSGQRGLARDDSDDESASRSWSRRRARLPRPAVDAPIILRCTVPSGLGDTPRDVVLQIQSNLSLTVHDTHGEFLGSGELAQDGIEWSPGPMALCTLAREMLDTYAEGIGRVFGDGLVTVNDWTRDRRALLLFAPR